MVHRQDRKSACSVVDAWVLLRQRTDGTKRHRNASDVVGVCLSSASTTDRSNRNRKRRHYVIDCATQKKCRAVRCVQTRNKRSISHLSCLPSRK